MCTPRHATISWGEIRIFSVKIRINPYPLQLGTARPCILHLFIDVSQKRSRDSYRDAVCKKSRHCVIKIDSQLQRTIKLFCFAIHIHKLFSVICLKSVSQRDTPVSSQKRPKSVLDTDNPYQVACLNMPANITCLVRGLNPERWHSKRMC